VLPVRDTGLLFLVADVMGKGIPAALFAAILRSVVHSLPQNFDNPAQLLSAVNRILYDDFSRVDMFATALVAYLDTSERRLLAASAGHCPLLIAQVGEAKLETIEASGPPLGVIPEIGYFAQSVTLRRGARVLLYTDGITECANPQGEMFSETRLVDWFAQRRLSGRAAPALKSQLLEELARYQSGQVPRDDQTFILIAEDSV
jgi:serine phosphatase RsbU (regulator of sigma subunit)